jgi:hypothetical protein
MGKSRRFFAGARSILRSAALAIDSFRGIAVQSGMASLVVMV